jgi:hypothetical protein
MIRKIIKNPTTTNPNPKKVYCVEYSAPSVSGANQNLLTKKRRQKKAVIKNPKMTNNQSLRKEYSVGYLVYFDLNVR